jgi:4-hydroxy-2-oxoheptanedioate aldolase
MLKLNNYLSELKKYNISSIKQSLEDEGSSFSDLIVMRSLTKKNKLNLNVKIGGCEAKNDIFFCQKIQVDSIIAPMVESEYSLRKFISCIENNNKCKLFVNLETSLALKNIDKILNSNSFKKLNGLVIGRSDLAGSMGLEKKDVNKKKIFSSVSKAFKLIKSKNNNIILKMGGSITKKSLLFIKKLNEEKLVDFIETRNIEFRVNQKFLNNFSEAINLAFIFEKEWLRIRINNIKNNPKLKKTLKSRLLEIKDRLKNI